MHMRVRKMVVVGSHGQRDDHGGDCGTDVTAKVFSFYQKPQTKISTPTN